MQHLHPSQLRYVPYTAYTSSTLVSCSYAMLRTSNLLCNTSNNQLPSLINLAVSVDAKHHVYRNTQLTVQYSEHAADCAVLRTPS